MLQKAMRIRLLKKLKLLNKIIIFEIMPKYVMEYYIKFGIYLNIIFIIIKKIKVGAKK